MILGSSGLLSQPFVLLSKSVFVLPEFFSVFSLAADSFLLISESFSVSFAWFLESSPVVSEFSVLVFFLTGGRVASKASTCSLVREVLVRFTSSTPATWATIAGGRALRSTSPRSKTFKVPGKEEKRACIWLSVK